MIYDKDQSVDPDGISDPLDLFMEPKLIVEAQSIRTTNSQAIFGKIYLAAEPATYFPELGWTDFVASILVHSLKVVPGLRVRETDRVLSWMARSRWSSAVGIRTR